MAEVVRVLLALDVPGVAEEVMHFLDRDGRMRVVATAADDVQLREAVRQVDPDAVVASSELAPVVGRLGLERRVFVVETAETVGALRSAMQAGSSGFFVWPGDRDSLAASLARREVTGRSEDAGRARITAVYGPRGGVGTTFVATHLASALARLGGTCVLVDADPDFGDVAPALGVRPEGDVRTAADLAPVAGELTPAHLDGVMWRHAHGFRVLFAPEDRDAVGADHYGAILRALSFVADDVVVHLPRALGGVTRAGLDAAHRVLVVLSLDVLAFEGARRALRATGSGEHVDFVVNRASRGRVLPEDVARLFGKEPVAILAEDRGVAAAQDRGSLVSPRSRTGRAFTDLAIAMTEDRHARAS